MARVFPGRNLWRPLAQSAGRLVRPRPAGPDAISVGPECVVLRYLRHPRAKRYVLRLAGDGSARVTVPRGGSLAEARRFAESKTDWLAGQLERQRLARARRAPWRHGTRILLDGAEVELRVSPDGGVLALGDVRVRLRAGETEELRPAVRRGLLAHARTELPPRVLAAAARYGLSVDRVVVRNQRSRWGSCSHRRQISLNWRILHAPAAVQDYLITHELMHLREMNHGPRFWRLVEEACPAWREAETWLKRHNDLLRDGR